MSKTTDWLKRNIICALIIIYSCLILSALLVFGDKKKQEYFGYIEQGKSPIVYSLRNNRVDAEVVDKALANEYIISLRKPQKHESLIIVLEKQK